MRSGSGGPNAGTWDPGAAVWVRVPTEASDGAFAPTPSQPDSQPPSSVQHSARPPPGPGRVTGRPSVRRTGTALQEELEFTAVLGTRRRNRAGNRVRAGLRGLCASLPGRSGAHRRLVTTRERALGGTGQLWGVTAAETPLNECRGPGPGDAT